MKKVKRMLVEAEFARFRARSLGFAIVGGALVMASSASAVTQDWSGIQTAIQDEIAAVFPIGLAIMGAVLAVVIAKKVLKRIAS